MHLRDRGRGDRRAFETGVDLAERPAKTLLDFGNGLIGWKRWHAVLQQRQFGGDVVGQQVTAGGQHLAELDEDRAERFERLAQARATRGVQLAAVAPEAEDVHEPQRQGEPTGRIVFENQPVETEFKADADDFGETEEAHGKDRNQRAKL